MERQREAAIKEEAEWEAHRKRQAQLHLATSFPSSAPADPPVGLALTVEGVSLSQVLVRPSLSLPCSTPASSLSRPSLSIHHPLLGPSSVLSTFPPLASPLIITPSLRCIVGPGLRGLLCPKPQTLNPKLGPGLRGLLCPKPQTLNPKLGPGLRGLLCGRSPLRPRRRRIMHGCPL